MELRVLALFVLGTIAGSLANLAIYRLRFVQSDASPWTEVATWLASRLLPAWLLRPPPVELSGKAPTAAASKKRKSTTTRTTPKIAPRTWWDKIPVLGWYQLRREEPVRGARFWLRPLMLELLLGFAFVWLYHWEVVEGSLLLPIGLQEPPTSVLWANYLSHLLLISLMVVASFIDIDEQIIPDEVTVPGALAGLTIAALVPYSLLPVATLPPVELLDFLKLSSPRPWPDGLSGGQPLGLAIALAAVWMAAFALLPRVWRGRRGWKNALTLMAARIRRESWTYLVAGLAVAVSIGVVVVWNRGGDSWQALLSSLAGMAAGGGMVWMIRLIGAFVLRREAMGFGDVTLMAMIGTFLGWQAVLLVFFIGPLFGLVPALTETLLRRHLQTPIPYGPFLCLGALTVMVFWSPIWQYVEAIFSVGWLVPAVIVLSAPLMAILLGIMQLIKWIFARRAVSR